MPEPRPVHSVLFLGQGSVLNPRSSYFHLGCLSYPHPGQNPSEKGLLSPSPKKEPPNRPTMAPTHISQTRAGTQEQLPLYPKRPGSKVHSNAHHWSCRVPFYVIKLTTVAARRADKMEGVLAVSEQGVFAYWNEKGHQIIRLRLTPMCPPTPPQRGGQREGMVPTLRAVTSQQLLVRDSRTPPANRQMAWPQCVPWLTPQPVHPLHNDWPIAKPLSHLTQDR